MTKPENPPAFPTKGGMAFYFPEELREQIDKINQTIKEETQGLTIRDYFAAAAMQGIVSKPDCTNYESSSITRDAYKIADQMLKVRQDD